MCVCVYVCVYVCVCVCVLCSGCTDAFAQHIHMHQGVNQHEGMFMYSVCAKYCMGKERLKSLQLVHKPHS